MAPSKKVTLSLRLLRQKQTLNNFDKRNRKVTIILVLLLLVLVLKPSGRSMGLLCFIIYMQQLGVRGTCWCELTKANCAHPFPIPHSMMSFMLEAIETGQNGCIYTTEMDKCYKRTYFVQWSGCWCTSTLTANYFCTSEMLIKINKVQCFNI